MKTKKILTAGVIAAFGLAIMTSTTVFAQGNDTGQMKTIVQRVAQKFNLKESDVQAVFEEERKERIAEMEKRYSDKLDELVASGKITSAQKDLILKKNQELRSSMEKDRDSFKNMTTEQRKEDMEAKRTELESWAKSNGIDLQYLKILVHKGPMDGHGMGMKFKMKSSQ